MAANINPEALDISYTADIEAASDEAAQHLHVVETVPDAPIAHMVVELGPAEVIDLDETRQRLNHRELQRRRLEENRLFSRLDAGDTSAREALTERFYPFALSIAQKYEGRGESADDIKQVACIGLLKAIDRFDTTRGYAFTSFAVPTITGEIKRHFRDRTWALHVPRDLKERSINLYKTADKLSQKQANWTLTDLANEMGITEEEAEEAVIIQRELARRPTSLSAPYKSASSGDEEITVGSRIGDSKVQDSFEWQLQVSEVLSAIKKLPRRDQKIMIASLLGQTQNEIAEEVGLSQMQISRIVRKTTYALKVAVEGRLK